MVKVGVIMGKAIDMTGQITDEGVYIIDVKTILLFNLNHTFIFFHKTFF